MGGTDDPDNLVEVTIEEHARLHKQLWEDLGHWQDHIAWKMLSGQISVAEAIKETQRQYMTNRTVTDETRRRMGEAQKRRFSSQNHPMKGKKHKDESCKKMSESLLGHIPWNKGYKYTQEEREKLSKIHLNAEKYVCDICGKVCKGKGNLVQHLSSHNGTHVSKGVPKIK